MNLRDRRASEQFYIWWNQSGSKNYFIPKILIAGWKRWIVYKQNFLLIKGGKEKSRDKPENGTSDRQLTYRIFIDSQSK